MQHVMVLTVILLSSCVAVAQVESLPPSRQAPTDAAQDSQSQPDANHAALATRKRARLETTIMPSGKRSDCHPAGCTRYELKAPSPAR